MLSTESAIQIPSLANATSPSKPDISTHDDDEKRGIKRPAPTEEIEASTPADKRAFVTEKPPQAPTPAEENETGKKPQSIYEQELEKLISSRGRFTKEDMKKPPWTDYTRTMFGAKNKLRDIGFASGFMRWWFSEHKGMPEPVQPVSRTAWKLYYLKRQKDLGFATGGKKDAKTRKMVGEEWTGMTEEERKPYFEQLDEIQEKYAVDVEKYEADLLAWREMKKAMPVTGETCNCDFCTGEIASGPSAPAGYIKVPGK